MEGNEKNTATNVTSGQVPLLSSQRLAISKRTWSILLSDALSSQVRKLQSITPSAQLPSKHQQQEEATAASRPEVKGSGFCNCCMVAAGGRGHQWPCNAVNSSGFDIRMRVTSWSRSSTHQQPTANSQQPMWCSTEASDVRPCDPVPKIEETAVEGSPSAESRVHKCMRATMHAVARFSRI